MRSPVTRVHAWFYFSEKKTRHLAQDKTASLQRRPTLRDRPDKSTQKVLPGAFRRMRVRNRQCMRGLRSRSVISRKKVMPCSMPSCLAGFLLHPISTASGTTFSTTDLAWFLCASE